MRFLVLLRSRCHIIRRLIKVKRCRKETFLISMYFRPDTKYTLTCLSKLGVKRNPKIYVNFYRKDHDVIVVHTKRIYKRARHTYGMIHLIFFDDENNIQKVFDVTWIE